MESQTQQRIQDYEIIEGAAHFDEMAVMSTLRGLFNYRKQYAQEFKKGIHSDEQQKQIRELIDMCNTKICQTLFIPVKIISFETPGE